MTSMRLFATAALMLAAFASADYCVDNNTKYRYGGSPLQASTTVYNLYVGNSFTNNAINLNNDFLKSLMAADSPYFEWLCEYNTDTQQITKPTFGGFARHTNTTAGTMLTLTALRDLVAAHILSGDFPAPTDNGLNTTFIVYLGDQIRFTDPVVGTSCKVNSTGFCTEHVVVPFSGDVNVYNPDSMVNPPAVDPNSNNTNTNTTTTLNTNAHLFIGIVSDLTLCACDGVDIRPKASRVLLNTMTNPMQTYHDRDANVPNGWQDICHHDISSVQRCHDTGLLTLASGQNFSTLVAYGYSNQQGKCVSQVATPVCGPFADTASKSPASHVAPASVLTLAVALVSAAFSVFHMAQ